MKLGLLLLSSDIRYWLNAILVGKVNLCSPDHVSLLVHRTFNVSIPRHHIPTDNWEFEYGPSEEKAEVDVDGPEEQITTESHTESSGRWVHKLTGDRLGGKDGLLEFTVVGYVNHVL